MKMFELIIHLKNWGILHNVRIKSAFPKVFGFCSGWEFGSRPDLV